MNYKKIIKSDILETISKIADENGYEIFVVGGYVCGKGSVSHIGSVVGVTVCDALMFC